MLCGDCCCGSHRPSHCLLIFEDLHWVDGETQALLDGLVERLGTAPLLLLVSYRPEYQHGWGGKTYYTQLRIDPLPGEGAEDSSLASSGAIPDLRSVRRLLIDRTEGNPFFPGGVRTGRWWRRASSSARRGRYRLARAPETISGPRHRPGDPGRPH